MLIIFVLHLACLIKAFILKKKLVRVHFIFLIFCTLSERAIYWLLGGSDIDKIVKQNKTKKTSVTVNKYRFCILVIGHINKHIIGIGY